MPEIGEMVKCTETGKVFQVAKCGEHTFNYATGFNGEIFSDEGVDIREKRELLDRSRPFTAYLSSDLKHFTGWKGNVLGTVVSSTTVHLARWSFTHGKTMQAVRIRDVHGKFWYGRGSGGICVNVRACKG